VRRRSHVLHLHHPAATTTSSATGAATTPAAGSATIGAVVDHRARGARGEREADVRVRAAGCLRFLQRDVGHAFELRFEHSAGRPSRDELSDEVVRDERGRRRSADTHADFLEEITTG